MPRIVLVSNRVTDVDAATQAGGVSVAIADLLINKSAVWFGWNGEVTESNGTPPLVSSETVGRSTLVTTPLCSNEFRDYYLGYSNSVLWPVFHNRLDLAQFEAGYFPEYVRVNRRFAAAIVKLLLPDDIIWVHDYHFILLAAEMRALGVTNPIGFFLHIPVPPSQAFLAVPEHVELADALAAYDLVGLQTQQDTKNLIDFFQHAVSGQLLPDGRVRVGNRIVKIESLPVGIDVVEFAGDANDQRVTEADPAELRIIGIDRLDYTKGLPHKFRAYGRFLENNSKYRGRVVLSQIAPPTRQTLEAYSDIRAELEALAGAINGQYGELDWVPINYMHRAVDRKQLFGIYRGSRVGLVTPLRDGMNLVAKEYIAAQNPDDPGVLVLSRFAGAAEQLEAAVIVNPYNVVEMADAIKFALEMPLDERRRRHKILHDVVSADANGNWSETFISNLSAVAARNTQFKDAGGVGVLMRALNLRSSPHFEEKV